MDNSKRKITKIAREVGKFAARTLRADGIGTGEFDVLHLIRKRPGIRAKEICSSLALDKGAVARMLQRMEKKGYIVRKPDSQDGRSQLLYATEKADELKSSKARIETLFYSWLLEDLTPQERETFSILLDRLYLKCKRESRSGFQRMTEIVGEDEGNEE